ncbi:MAG TPA: undecaprenyl-diphosphate phosphatase [Bacteroidia bacterium]
MTIIEAIILAIVEGLTEFLPISSTGHMLIAASLMGMEPTDFLKNYVVIIQFGAILSVCMMYYRRFIKDFKFYIKLFVAFIPAGVFGLLFNDLIEQALESPIVVGINLFLGGIFLLFVDKIFAKNDSIEDSEPNIKQSFIIGLFQVIAMIPGVSRSAATIVGGLTQKLNRKSAAEFSFFLAVPTMLAACGYKVLKMILNAETTHVEYDWTLLIIGSLIALFVAIFAIKFFIEFLTKYGFKWFGWYRILVGGIIILLYYLNIELNLVG